MAGNTVFAVDTGSHDLPVYTGGRGCLVRDKQTII